MPETYEIIKYMVLNDSAFFAALAMLIYTLIKLSTESIVFTIVGLFIISTALVLQFNAVNTKMWKDFYLETKLLHIEKILKDHNLSSISDNNYTQINEAIKNNLPQNPFHSKNK